MYAPMIFLFALVGSSFAGLVDFRGCEGNVNQPQVVMIDGCDGFNCALTQGQTVNVRVEFVTPVDATKVEAVSQVGSESSTTSVCGNDLDCPLRTGEYYIHKGSFTVGKSSVSANSMTYKLQSNGQPLVCFTYPITVA